MIYAFSRSLETGLHARGFPYRVHYTPFLDAKQNYGSSVVVAHSRGVNEVVGGVIGPQTNPKKILTRYMSSDVYVFAKSSKPAARVSEHEFECDAVVDGVLTEADRLVRGVGAPTFAVPEARYLTAEERTAIGGYVEQWPGVVYYLRILVPRGVSRLTYKGDGAPEATVARVNTTGHVRTDPDAPADDANDFHQSTTPGG